jgi:hypothetical protein
MVLQREGRCEEGHAGMNIESAVLFLCVIVAVAVAIWGLLGRTRSPIIGIIAVFVSILAAVGAWYAWAETKSTPWTNGFSVVVLAAILSAVRQFSGVCSTENGRHGSGTPQE